MISDEDFWHRVDGMTIDSGAAHIRNAAAAEQRLTLHEAEVARKRQQLQQLIDIARVVGLRAVMNGVEPEVSVCSDNRKRSILRGGARAGKYTLIIKGWLLVRNKSSFRITWEADKASNAGSGDRSYHEEVALGDDGALYVYPEDIASYNTYMYSSGTRSQLDRMALLGTKFPYTNDGTSTNIHRLDSGSQYPLSPIVISAQIGSGNRPMFAEPDVITRGLVEFAAQYHLNG